MDEIKKPTPTPQRGTSEYELWQEQRRQELYLDDQAEKLGFFGTIRRLFKLETRVTELENKIKIFQRTGAWQNDNNNNQ
jgi:hypothetical protein